MIKVINDIRYKNILIGSILFSYFLLLLFCIFIPQLRIGIHSGFSIAFIYRCFVFGSFFVLSLVIFFTRKERINLVLSISFIFFFLSNLSSIFLPYNNIQVATTDKVMASFYLFSVVITVLVFIELLPDLLNRKSIFIFFILIDITMMICCLYSLIAEFNSIINAFTAIGEDAHFYQIHSFFDNKNSYGFMIFVAIIGTLFIYHYSRSKWIIPIQIFFGINLIISRAKTAIIILVLITLVFLYYKCVKTFKEHKRRNSLIFGSLCLLTVLFTLIVTVPTIYESSTFFSHLSNYVKEAFIGQGIRSINARINNLLNASSLFANHRIFLGYGEYVCRQYANTCCIALGSIDSAYIYNLLAGGIVKTILFIYCYYLIFKKVVELSNRNEISLLFKMFIWSLEISLLLYGMMENFQVLGSNHSSIIYLVFAYIVPCVYVNEGKSLEESLNG